MQQGKRFIYPNLNPQKSYMHGSCWEQAAFHSWTSSEPAVLTLPGQEGNEAEKGLSNSSIFFLF